MNNRRNAVELARGLRRRQTSAEEMPWGRLRNRRLAGANFRRQHPLGRYIADFYCHEANLAIELEGDLHDREGQREYDEIRRETIEQQGIVVLRIKNDEVNQDLDSVLIRIMEALTSLTKPLSLRERGQG